jgi:tetratricopeptide (TPR) repeat protein
VRTSDSVVGTSILLFLLPALAILITFQSVSAENPPALAFAQYERGLDLWNQAKYEDARAAFEEAIRIAPEYTNAYRSLHDLRTRNLGESREQLVKELNDQLGRHPTSAMWHYLRSRYEDNHEAKLNLGRRAIELDPDYPWGYYTVAYALQGIGELDQAVGEYKRALEADPSHLESHYGLALLYMNELDHYTAAVIEFQNIVSITPDFSRGWAQFQLERLLYRILPVDSVAARYQKLAESEDSEAKWFAYVGLGNAHRNQRQYSEAVDAYRTALSVYPKGRWRSRIHYHLGESLYRLGDEKAAATAYDSVLASGDSNAYYYSRAKVFRDNITEPGRTGSARILDVPYESQFGRPTCAGTCISMILNHFGDTVNADDVNAFVHNPLYGQTGHQDNIVLYPLRHGYVADWSHASLAGYLLDSFKGYDKGRLNDLRRLIDAGIPIEISVQGGTHAIVVVGYDDRKGSVIVHNSQWVPSSNVFQEIPVDEFIRDWSTSLYSYFTILPPSKKKEVPSWNIRPLLSQYPNDYTGNLLGTSIPRRTGEPSLYRNSPDRYAAPGNASVSFGFSIDRFGEYQRLWLLSDYRRAEEKWRYEVGFSNKSLPTPKAPAFVRAFWEDDLYGGSFTIRPFQSLDFGIEGYCIQSDDVEVVGLPWERGTDIYLACNYEYGTLKGWLRNRGWMTRVGLSGSTELLGSDYSYGRLDFEIIKAFPLPFASSILLRDRTIWTEGETPLQARVIPGVNMGFRNARTPLPRDNRANVFGVELRTAVLTSTPLHPDVPVITKVFYDAAFAWPEERAVSDISISEFKKSWGVGLEYAIFNLDVAFPADGGDPEKTEMYFNLIGISQLMLD